VIVVVRMRAVRMTLLSMRVCVVRMRMRVAAVAVAVVVEKKKTDKVGKETAGTDDEDDDGMRDILRLDEALDRFEKDGQTERDEEDTVDQGTEGFGALPLRRVSKLLRMAAVLAHSVCVGLGVGLLAGNLDCPQSDEK
jgi:hypothetical protein